MSWESEIFSYLTSVPGVAALIGARLYPVNLPQTPTLPAATFTQVSHLPQYAHDGPIGWGRARWQFDAYGTTPQEAAAVADALSAALSGWHSVDGRMAAFEVDRRDFHEAEIGRYRKSLDAFIHREE